MLAKICICCGSDLTWRRYLFFGNSTLALLTALVAVTAAVGPTLLRLFTPSDSAISGVAVGGVLNRQVPGDDDNISKIQISFLLSNRGLKTGAVEMADLYVYWKDDASHSKEIGILLSPPSEKPYFLESGRSEEAVFTPAFAAFLKQGTSYNDFVEFGGSESTIAKQHFDIGIKLCIVNANGSVAKKDLIIPKGRIRFFVAAILLDIARKSPQRELRELPGGWDTD